MVHQWMSIHSGYLCVVSAGMCSCVVSDCVLYVQACVHVCGVACESVCLCVLYCACAGVSVLSMCTFVGMHVACVLDVFLLMFVFLLHISTCVFSSNRNVLCMS